jgi:hypothetical protein
LRRNARWPRKGSRDKIVVIFSRAKLRRNIFYYVELENIYWD